MRTLLENLREDERCPALREMKWAGRYIVNDIGQAIVEIERAAAPELLEAAELLEVAEDAHANCDECEGQGVPELCEVCFPLFDKARVTRRLALEKAGRWPIGDGWKSVAANLKIK